MRLQYINIINDLLLISGRVLEEKMRAYFKCVKLLIFFIRYKTKKKEGKVHIKKQKHELLIRKILKRLLDSRCFTKTDPP